MEILRSHFLPRPSVFCHGSQLATPNGKLECKGAPLVKSIPGSLSGGRVSGGWGTEEIGEEWAVDLEGQKKNTYFIGLFAFKFNHWTLSQWITDILNYCLLFYKLSFV